MWLKITGNVTDAASRKLLKKIKIMMKCECKKIIIKKKVIIDFSN